MSLKNQLFSQKKLKSYFIHKAQIMIMLPQWVLQSVHRTTSSVCRKNKPYIATFYKERKMEETSGRATEESSLCHDSRRHVQDRTTSTYPSSPHQVDVKLDKKFHFIAPLKRKTLHCHHNTMLYVHTCCYFQRGTLTV